MLRASSETHEQGVDVGAIMDGSVVQGIEYAEQLSAFAEAIVLREVDDIRTTRESLVAAAGTEAMVDAAGVASNFERMVRIADSTGITLGALDSETEELRESLGINRFKKSTGG